MNNFTIKDIENMCGIKAHTLRIWEQRYQDLFIPKRKDSQHRVYDCEDLKSLLRISFLYHHGYKISKIANLSAAEIQQEIAGIKPQACDFEFFVHQLIEAGLQLDSEVFEAVADEIVLQIGIEKSIVHVFYPFLHRIGLLWMTNHVIPAQEHFSSHIISQKIICAIDKLETKQQTDNNVVIFSPKGEQHEIPLLVVSYLLKKEGIPVTYFGVNVCTNTLQYYCEHHQVSHFYTHLVTHLDSCGINNYICCLSNKFPAAQIVISGPACNCIPDKPANLLHLQSLDDVNAFIRLLLKGKELVN